MMRILVGLVLLTGSAAAEPTTPSEAPAATPAVLAPVPEGSAVKLGEPAAMPRQEPQEPVLGGTTEATPVPPGSEPPAAPAKPSVDRVPPPAVIFLQPRLPDLQATHGRHLLPAQVGGGVAPSDGAPVVAADGLGLEVERTYLLRGERR